MSRHHTLDYLEKHKLRAVIESAVNEVCAGQPDNPFDFLAKRFAKLSEEHFGPAEIVEEVKQNVVLPQIVFVLGPPGCGKGTVCEVISREYGYVHLSTGDLLRLEQTNNGPRAQAIDSMLTKGQLVSSEIVVDLLWRRIQEHVQAGNTKFLVDGFPRSNDNLLAWNQVVGDKAHIQVVLSLQCDQATVTQRLLARGRADDDVEIIKTRYASHEKETLPVIQRLSVQGAPVRQIDAAGKPQQTADAARATMGGRKPQVIFVLGGPGAGKGTQCARMVEDFGFVHLSAGDLLRAERSSGSKNAELINDYIKRGAIVPVEITVNLIKAAMQKAIYEDDKYNFLIDGFPRNANNQEGWDKVMGNFVTVRFVLFFDCPEEVMEQRCLQRGLTSGRVDDNIESIKQRFHTYVGETRPIIEMYERMGKVHQISSIPQVDEVYVEVQSLLKSEGF